MPTEKNIEIIDSYWAKIHNCSIKDYYEDKSKIIINKGEDDYLGAFLFFRNNFCSVEIHEQYLRVNPPYKFIDFYCSKCKLPVRIYYEAIKLKQSEAFEFYIKLITIGKYILKESKLKMFYNIFKWFK